LFSSDQIGALTNHQVRVLTTRSSTRVHPALDALDVSKATTTQITADDDRDQSIGRQSGWGLSAAQIANLRPIRLVSSLRPKSRRSHHAGQCADVGTAWRPTTTALGLFSSDQIGAFSHHAWFQSLTTTQLNALSTPALDALDVSKATTTQIVA